MTLAQRAAEVGARQDSWEASLEAILDHEVTKFVAAALADAFSAVSSDTLLAAANPFAFTNIMARWKLAVDQIMATPASRLAHPALLDEVTERILREASIPHEATSKATDVLVRSREEQWSRAKTRRALRAELLPAPPPGSTKNKQSVEWSWHKARVRMIARTAATRATSLSTLEDSAGYGLKRWLTRRDSAVRDSHADANGQTVPRDGAFTVGGYPMQYPGDVSAPLAETASCRCVMVMLNDGEDDMTTDTLTAAGTTTFVPWAGPIAFEGIITGDGRMVDHGGWYWDEPPYTLRRLPADFGAHDGAVAVGRVDRIERRPGGIIWAEGVIDMGSEQGVEAARLIGEKISNGISVDPDDVSFEVRVKAELLDSILGEDPQGAGLAMTDSDGRVTIMRYQSGDELTVYTSSRIRAITLCDIPAFSDARINLVADEITYGEPTYSAPALVASAAPSCPPAEWFDDPHFDGVAAMTVTDEGRVFGHAAAWESCHIGYPGECVPPPRSPSGYAYFHTGAAHVMHQGQIRKIAIGRLTIDTGHAGDKASANETLAHYDNTGTAVAYVRAGEDQFGIWVAGSILPQATDEQVRTLMASPPSGDWRAIGGALEMVAVLHVNVGGFAIPRPAGFIASGEMQSLVAAGMVDCASVGRPAELDDEERRFVRELMAERRLWRASELAGRVKTALVPARRARVAAMAAKIRGS